IETTRSMKSGKGSVFPFLGQFFLGANGNETRIQCRPNSPGKRVHRYRSERGHGKDDDDLRHCFALAGRAGDPDRATSGNSLPRAGSGGTRWWGVAKIAIGG